MLFRSLRPSSPRVSAFLRSVPPLLRPSPLRLSFPASSSSSSSSVNARTYSSTSSLLFDIRNLAIVAHVDHGKTTLVDKLLEAASRSSPSYDPLTDNNSRVCVMDAGALEMERGITITSKATRLDYYRPLPGGGGKREAAPTIINVVDTPGHADFAGEVDRILSMVDGVCLVVDAGEGPMSQTKYVLSRALSMGLKPIVLLNKLDRGEAITNVDSKNGGKVESELFDLFDRLGATEDQLDYPTLYAAARSGWVCDNLPDAITIVKGGFAAGETPTSRGVDMSKLLDAIITHIPPPKKALIKSGDAASCHQVVPVAGEPKAGQNNFALAATMVGRDRFLGRTATGKVYQGALTVGQKVTYLRRDGSAIPDADRAKSVSTITGVFIHRGVTRAPLGSEKAVAGDIVMLAGLPDSIAVGDTIVRVDEVAAADAAGTPLLPVSTLPLAPPTLSMDFGANDSPLSGKEGTIVTSSRVRDRLVFETDNNVTLAIGPCEGDAEKNTVYARGELQLGILIETMRREGYELTVSPPKIVFSEDEDGNKMEPFEEVTVDVDSEYVGDVVNSLTGPRKASMIDMKETGSGKSRIVFEMPSRGLLGFGPEIATQTRGSAVVTHTFIDNREYAGPLGEGLDKGKLVSMDMGKATTYALNLIAERGVLFIDVGDEVYPGMVIGENSRSGDLEVNPVKAKELTNVRSVNKEEKAKIPPPRRLNVEEMIAYMGDDEVIEVTPLSVRLRKLELDAGARARATKLKKKQNDPNNIKPGKK